MRSEKRRFLSSYCEVQKTGHSNRLFCGVHRVGSFGSFEGRGATQGDMVAAAAVSAALIVAVRK